MKSFLYFILGILATLLFFSIYSRSELNDENTYSKDSILSIMDEEVIVEKVVDRLLEMGVIQKKEANLAKKVSSSASIRSKDTGIRVKIPANVPTFEISTKNGLVKLYISMPKDEIKNLLGIPSTTDMYTSSNTVYEKWNYMGRNSVIPEFTFHFENGKLKSYNQYRE